MHDSTIVILLNYNSTIVLYTSVDIIKIVLVPVLDTGTGSSTSTIFSSSVVLDTGTIPVYIDRSIEYYC